MTATPSTGPKKPNANRASVPGDAPKSGMVAATAGKAQAGDAMEANLPAAKKASAPKKTSARTALVAKDDAVDATATKRPPLPPPTPKGTRDWAGPTYGKQSPRATTHHRLRASRGR